ncbi:MAG TPA: hypothetical protein VKV25_01075, partial [Acidimicrobiales bacterium]|nr:hypothetical protein [Acidimicrobiales bacterium]
MRRAAQDRRRRAISRLAVGSAATVVVVAVSAVVARAASERLPPEQVRTVLRTTVRLAGRDPALPWPARGEAALALGAGGLIGTSGPSAPLPTASVAKVMTAYLVLRDHPLAPGRPGFVITVTPAQAAGFRQRLADGESLLRVHAAETLTEWQALQALLLASADNIADILAEDDAGTVGAFVAKMNAAAHALGMTHTLFTDPSGLDPRTASDATDLLPLAQAAMAVPAFAALVDERQADIPGVATFGNYDTL